ncbi:NADAR family protein [Listeria farberi]|uniref:NADAR family protein n=1 Tax=Listeria farberi TaxID=2713500 RepID=UPI001FEC7A35|nr:NADAR family protein [Listeria farberi]
MAYPEIERYSIGWRMGYGEDYQTKFFKWWETLSSAEKLEYQTLFPEPIAWDGWWKDNHPDEIISHGDFCVPIWEQSGLPKYNLNQLQNEMQPELYLFENCCFSHYWMDEFSVSTQKYCCMEQFMIEQKAELFNDTTIKQKVLETNSLEQIQALDKQAQPFDKKIWDKFKYAIALQGNWNKFNQKRILREFLLSTGDTLLVGTSLDDSIWGIQLSADSPDAQDLMKWQGQNLLGFALMEVRDELGRVWQNESLCDWSLVE